MDGEYRSEDELVLRIARALPSAVGIPPATARARGALALGIGDDAAILAPKKGAEWVLSTDAFLEGIHFLGNVHPADSVGYKALARATSDLAAMGARPRLFFLTLAIPEPRTGAWLDGFLHGMARAARELGMLLAGGDTSRFHSVAMAITVLGQVRPGKAVRRSGGRPGDILYVSGRLGRAQLGLELIRRLPTARVRASLARRGQLRPPLQRLLRPHVYPAIRLKLGSWLAERGVTSAMMDLSDGLSTDLARLCAASGVGARVWAERVPRVRVPPGKLGAGLDALAMALHGGDDYELLFTVQPRQVKRLQRAPGFSEITAIGELERGGGVSLVDADGRAMPLRPRGWDSFRRR